MAMISNIEISRIKRDVEETSEQSRYFETDTFNSDVWEGTAADAAKAELTSVIRPKYQEITELLSELYEKIEVANEIEELYEQIAENEANNTDLLKFTNGKIARLKSKNFGIPWGES